MIAGENKTKNQETVDTNVKKTIDKNLLIKMLRKMMMQLHE